MLFEQVVPLGDLTIRWVGSEDGDVEVTDEFDVEREVDQEVDQQMNENEADGSRDDDEGETT